MKIQMILHLLCLLYQCVRTDFSVNHAQVQQSKMDKTLNYNLGGLGRGVGSKQNIILILDP